MNFVLIFVSILTPNIPAYGWYYDSLSSCQIAYQAETQKHLGHPLSDMPRVCLPLINGIPIESYIGPPPEGEVVD